MSKTPNPSATLKDCKHLCAEHLAKRGVVQPKHTGFRLPDEQALRLENFAGAEFFRILSNPYREVCWAALRTFFERKFAAAPVPLGQPEAIGIAEGLFADAVQYGLEAAEVLRMESFSNLPTQSGDDGATPQDRLPTWWQIS